MALSFHPNPDAILICNYQTGFVEPEMVKTRLCVVVTPRLRRRERLCTVIPLSLTPPEHVCDYHREIEFERELPKPWEGKKRWAKCDMFATVSHGRLSPIGVGRGPSGTRKYIYPTVSLEQLKEIRAGMLCALTFQQLTQYL